MYAPIVCKSLCIPLIWMDLIQPSSSDFRYFKVRHQLTHSVTYFEAPWLGRLPSHPDYPNIIHANLAFFKNSQPLLVPINKNDSLKRPTEPTTRLKKVPPWIIPKDVSYHQGRNLKHPIKATTDRPITLGSQITRSMLLLFCLYVEPLLSVCFLSCNKKNLLLISLHSVVKSIQSKNTPSPTSPWRRDINRESKRKRCMGNPIEHD